MRSHRFGRRTVVVAVLGLVLAASVAVVAAGKDKAASKDQAKDPTKDPTRDPAAATSSAAAPTAKADTVHISVQTVPPRKAQVKWGSKNLGFIPTPRALVIERPRDSGPLDLVIRAAGYLPVHTRAYTFSDSRVAVKLTQSTDKSKLFGYKQEPNPDGGPPPDPTATAAPLPRLETPQP